MTVLGWHLKPAQLPATLSVLSGIRATSGGRVMIPPRPARDRDSSDPARRPSLGETRTVTPSTS